MMMKISHTTRVSASPLLRTSPSLLPSLRTSLLASVIASMLAGCMVGPDYHRPAVATPATWKELPGWTEAQLVDRLQRPLAQ